jgi:hypothetical protein
MDDLFFFFLSCRVVKNVDIVVAMSLSLSGYEITNLLWILGQCIRLFPFLHCNIWILNTDSLFLLIGYFRLQKAHLLHIVTHLRFLVLCLGLGRPFWLLYSFKWTST